MTCGVCARWSSTTTRTSDATPTPCSCISATTPNVQTSSLSEETTLEKRRTKTLSLRTRGTTHARNRYCVVPPYRNARSARPKTTWHPAPSGSSGGSARVSPRRSRWWSPCARTLVRRSRRSRARSRTWTRRRRRKQRSPSRSPPRASRATGRCSRPCSARRAARSSGERATTTRIHTGAGPSATRPTRWKASRRREQPRGRCLDYATSCARSSRRCTARSSRKRSRRKPRSPRGWRFRFCGIDDVGAAVKETPPSVGVGAPRRRESTTRAALLLLLLLLLLPVALPARARTRTSAPARRSSRSRAGARPRG